MIIIRWGVTVSVEEHASKAKHPIQHGTGKECCCQRPPATIRRQLYQGNHPKKPPTKISYSKQRRASGIGPTPDSPWLTKPLAKLMLVILRRSASGFSTSCGAR